jgi:hypothetical protein
MTFLEILAVLRAAGEITEYAADLIASLKEGQRDPTPDEIADVKAKQAAAEAAWATARPAALANPPAAASIKPAP